MIRRLIFSQPENGVQLVATVRAATEEKADLAEKTLTSALEFIGWTLAYREKASLSVAPGEAEGSR